MGEFADTVEYDHLIVDGVTDSRQHGTYECLVNLKRERHPAPAYRIHTYYNKGIEEEGEDGAYRVSHVAEADQDVQEDGNQGQDDGDDGSACDILGY